MRNNPELAIPKNTPITLYNSDGTTEIKVGASPGDYLEGNSDENPLIVRSIPTMPTMDYGATWKVSGIIANSLSVKGVRSRMYRHADNQLGYYEQDQPAFYYDESGENLKINVLFKTEERALKFESLMINESITFQSPMNSLEISAQVTSGTFQLGGRIFTVHYIPADFESPQNTPSVITLKFSTVEETSDIFKYQRIEKLSVFGGIGKAESCHLMSASHCKMFPQSYDQYDIDPNNRLAMSRDLHGWFDQLNSYTPLFYLKIVSITDAPVLEGRFKVMLAVVALNQESANMIFCRLIEGSSATDNPLIMHTFVHVTKPNVFKKCLEWKERQILKEWEDYFSMDSAIP